MLFEISFFRGSDPSYCRVTKTSSILQILFNEVYCLTDLTLRESISMKENSSVTGNVFGDRPFCEFRRGIGHYVNPTSGEQKTREIWKSNVILCRS